MRIYTKYNPEKLIIFADVVTLLQVSEKGFRNLYNKANSTVPRPVGLWHVKPGSYGSMLFDASVMVPWVKEYRTKYPAGVLTKNLSNGDRDLTFTELYALTKTNARTLPVFLRRNPSFPLPTASGRFNAKEVRRWLKAWSETGIRYTTLRSRERFEAPNTLVFKFISGALT